MQAGTPFEGTGVEEGCLEGGLGVGVEGCGVKDRISNSEGCEGGGREVVWKAITAQSQGFVAPRSLMSAGMCWRLMTKFFSIHIYIFDLFPYIFFSILFS
jgi:hypothetical protein